MDCQVCFMPYNTSTRMPKTLVCGHTFCMECLTKIQDAASSSIRCPKDRKTSVIPEGGITELITNFTVLEMLSDDCLDCHEKTQDGQCVPEHCSKLLCSDCKASHLKEFSKELVTELEAMKKQMSKQQAMCDDNTDLTKMMDQSQAAVAEISRVFDVEKEKMIKVIRRKQETDGNDYFEWQKNFNVCLAKGRSSLNKIMSEITFGADSLSGKYLSELKKQIISEKEAICEMELRRSQCSSFDASGVQQEFDRFMPVIYDLVVPSHKATTMASGATVAESNQDVTETALVPPAGSGAGESSHPSRETTSQVTGAGAGSTTAGDRDNEPQMTIPDYTAVSLDQTYGKYGSGAEEFSHPCGVAISPVTGNIAITDSSNHRIHILTADFHPVRVFGTEGSGENQFKFPRGVCFSSTGRLFIADSHNHRIHQVTEEGEHISTFGSEGKTVGKLKRPHGICWERGLLYICDYNNSRLHVMKETGELVRTIGRRGCNPGQFNDKPLFIAVSGQHDRLVVSDYHIGNLHIFSLDGQHKRTIRASQYPYNILMASGVAIDSLGQVIVSDCQGKCILVLGEDRVNSTIRLPAGEKMEAPRGVTVTQDGSIIVCDWRSHKIYKFTTGHH